MPPSIDPVTNIFGTGSSLFGRIVISFVAGWVGNYFSAVIGYFTEWSDLTEPLDALIPFYSGPEVLLTIVLWPWVIVIYMLEVPLYALFLLITVPICVFKIILSEDPVLFWAVLLAFVLTPASFIIHWTYPGMVPLGLFMTGLGAALWYAANLEHPECIDWVREKTGL